VRIAIVNDTLIAVEGLRRVLVSDGRHQIAWIAHDGEEAVQKAVDDTPDLILMDLFMPRQNGVEATRGIMETAPCPILVVTANVEDHAAMAFEAMGAGALDAVNTPVWENGSELTGADDLLTKISMIGKLVDVGADPVPSGSTAAGQEKTGVPLVCIGSSSGGPQALARLLAGLPADFPAAIIVAQHVDEQFAEQMAVWLDAQTPLKVKAALEGDEPRPGTVLLAKTDDHLVLEQGGCIGYTANPRDAVFRPSVDVLFRSVAQNWEAPVYAVLLTGMGQDGAQGMLTLRDAGALTIAQDERSSAVYGMPKAAAEAGAAKLIVDLDAIAAVLIDNIANESRKISV
jgi:two-component system response regulator WspF